MKKYYYQVLINGKAFPYEGFKIWNRESAEVYYNQAKRTVKTHAEYNKKYCNVELVKIEYV